MAAAFRRCLGRNLSRNLAQIRSFQTKSQLPKSLTISTACGVCTSLVVSWYIVRKYRKSTTNVLAKEELGDGEKKRVAMQTQRELRFLSFASLEYEGCVYMTPQDFLESVTEDTPRPRTGRKILSTDEVDKILKTTPARGKGSPMMFRNLHDRGLISYTEYLFLICVLTKPQSGFRIAFNMFDTDGNQRVDKNEFLVLIAIFREPYFKRKDIQRTAMVRPAQAPNLWNLVRKRDSIEGLEQIIPGPAQRSSHDDNMSTGMLDSSSGSLITDTTLLVHFFGRRGRDMLKYDDFHRFMDNLQTEVLELEYNEFSRGMPTITEEEFAQILLRYTILSSDDKKEYLTRLNERVLDTQGISFKDFKDFCQFLNSLDDFAIAMRMYTYADKPISEEDFRRSVKACTGQSLHPHLVHTVFQLFDNDGDGHLSHKEFFSVMKDRLRRGFKTQWGAGNWESFKTCVKNEMRRN